MARSPAQPHRTHIFLRRSESSCGAEPVIPSWMYGCQDFLDFFDSDARNCEGECRIRTSASRIERKHALVGVCLAFTFPLAKWSRPLRCGSRLFGGRPAEMHALGSSSKLAAQKARRFVHAVAASLSGQQHACCEVSGQGCQRHEESGTKTGPSQSVCHWQSQAGSLRARPGLGRGNRRHPGASGKPSRRLLASSAGSSGRGGDKTRFLSAS